MNMPFKAPRRKNAFNIFRDAARLGSFGEYPMLSPEVDPQVHLSRNAVDQPFFLVCEKDTVLAQFSGRSRVMFKQGAERYANLVPGDYLYVPGGIAHRILITTPGEVLRYKARAPGREAVEWYCDDCGELLDRHGWNSSEIPAQAGYLAGCERWNAEPERRTCARCGTVHEEADLTPFRWGAIAEALTRADDDGLDL